MLSSAFLFGSNLRQRATRVSLLPLLIWFVLTKLLALLPVFDFLFEPLRGLCEGLLQTSSICGRLRSKAYDIEVPLPDVSLDYFLYVALLIVTLAVLTVMATGASKPALKAELAKIKKSKPSAILLVYVLAAAVISLAALVWVVADMKTRRLPPELGRHLFAYVGLFSWFQALLLFRATRYAPPEPPEKLEPTAADYWNRRE